MDMDIRISNRVKPIKYMGSVLISASVLLTLLLCSPSLVGSGWMSVGAFVEFDMRHESYLYSIGGVHSKINWRIEAFEDTSIVLNVKAYQTSVGEPPLNFLMTVGSSNGSYRLYNQHIIVNATVLGTVKSIKLGRTTFQVSGQPVLNTTLGFIEAFELKHTRLIDFSLREETTLLVSKSTGIVIRQLIQWYDADSDVLGAEREHNISKTNVDIPLWSPPPFDFLKSYPWLPIVVIAIPLALIIIVIWKKRPFKKKAPTGQMSDK